ncbi:metallophosphoesterase family protein [Jatrophihabitans sp. DSM 45814]
MKLGLISDVHCAYDTLKETLAEFSDQVDEVLLAGDALYEYRFNNEVIELIREHQIRYILGNHEEVLLGPHGKRALSAPFVKAANVDFVRTIGTHLETVIDGKRLLMAHGSPWAPHNQYVHANSSVLERTSSLGVDFLVLGHTHIPMEVRIGHTLVVNPGSLEQSRERGQQGCISYAVLDTAEGAVEFHRRPITRRTEAAVTSRVAG